METEAAIAGGGRLKTIIRIVERAAVGEVEESGCYIRYYDNSHEDELGLGVLHLTRERSEAKRFDDAAEAFAFWEQQSRTVPMRPDGKPNRPITAYSVLMEKIDQ